MAKGHKRTRRGQWLVHFHNWAFSACAEMFAFGICLMLQQFLQVVVGFPSLENTVLCILAAVILCRTYVPNEHGKIFPTRLRN
uniref:Inner membrane protein n=1 Tax=Syphacia muris TaxID=451379 RepID=A0A0N5AAA8_9BILA